MSLASRVNAALATVNVQFVRKTGLERLRLLEQEFQDLLNEYQGLKAHYHQLRDRLHLPDYHSLDAPPPTDLPDGAAYLLIPSNTRLTELNQRYRSLTDPLQVSSRWTESFIQQQVDLYRFRAPGTYLGHAHALNSDAHYALAFYYLRSLDTRSFGAAFSEDALFGMPTTVVGDRTISQDWLDSLAELLFLERHLGLSQLTQFNVVDIGAGYGRFAHRLAQAVPHLGTVFCTDAIATSTFLCEYYLNLRGVSEMATTVPLDELRSTLAAHPVQLATSLRTFSDMPLETISTWLDALLEFQIPYLMVVPDAVGQETPHLLSMEKDGSRLDYRPLIEQRGYQAIACDPKFLDNTVQANGIAPTYHLLFKKLQ